MAAHESLRAIGRRLGRAVSTITREIARNKGVGRYRAADAEDRAWRRAKRPKPCLLAQRPALATYVADRLRDDWSPEQIAGTLKNLHPVGSGMRVSHETIYKTLFVETRGVLARCAHICGRGARSAAACTTPPRGSGARRFEGPSPFGSGRRRWRSVRRRGTGKATSCSVGIGRN